MMDSDWSRLKLILQLSIPVATSLFAQAIAILVNAAMVGRLGVDALAGVGIAAFAYTVFTSILFGIDAGVQAIVARRGGEGRHDLQGEVLTDGVLISAMLGAVLALISYLAGPTIMQIVASEERVADLGLKYLHAVSPALIFVGANYAFNAYWNGTGQPKFTLLVALIQLPSSILFSYFLIFGWGAVEGLGTTGAGLGILLSTLLALLVNFLLALTFRPITCFMVRPFRLPNLRSILAIGFPISAEQGMLHVNVMIFFWIVGLLGTNQLAVANVMVWLELLVILPAIGVGIITATLVAISLGAKEVHNAQRWGWEGASVATLMIAPISLVLFAFPATILSLFIQDPDAIALGVWPVRLLALSMCINTFGRVAGYGLRGAGATRSVALVNFGTSWFVQLPLSWLIGIEFGYGLFGVALVRLLSITIEAAVLTFLWSRSEWTNIQIPLRA